MPNKIWTLTAKIYIIHGGFSIKTNQVYVPIITESRTYAKKTLWLCVVKRKIHSIRGKSKVVGHEGYYQSILLSN